MSMPPRYSIRVLECLDGVHLLPGIIAGFRLETKIGGRSIIDKPWLPTDEMGGGCAWRVFVTVDSTCFKRCHRFAVGMQDAGRCGCLSLSD